MFLLENEEPGPADLNLPGSIFGTGPAPPAQVPSPPPEMTMLPVPLNLT